MRALECKSGVLYVGGDFVYAGNAIFSRAIASWSGTAWSSMASGMFFEGGESGQVLSLAFYDDGMHRSPLRRRQLPLRRRTAGVQPGGLDRLGLDRDDRVAR